MNGKPGDGAPAVSAFDAGCRYLASTERTSTQVRGHLRKKGYDQDAIDEAVRALVARGFLDDARYARLYVENRTRRSPRSGALLVRELLIRGVERDIAQHAVRELLATVPEDALALRALDRIASSRRDPERAARRLRSRGFRGAMALRAIRASAEDPADGGCDEHVPHEGDEGDGEVHEA